jgi:hypothetical protein
MTSFASTGSKKLFKAQKAAALAQALVAGPAAVIESFKNAGGYPWGIVPAALMAAQNATQVAAIKGTSMSGGGSAPRVGGGGGSTSTPRAATPGAIQSLGSNFDNQQAAPQSVINFNIAGDVIGETAELVLTRVRELVENNDAILIPPNSRQAAELEPQT